MAKRAGAYNSEKRRKEIKRQKKQEEKRLKRQHKHSDRQDEPHGDEEAGETVEPAEDVSE